MSTIKERTIEFVKSQGITMKHFEQKCRLSTGYVTSMRKGFGSEKLQNVLTAFPQLNRDWLLYGEGTMLNNCNTNVTDKTKEKEEVSDTAADPLLTALHEIVEMRKLFQEQVKNNQTQFNKFIEIIEKLTK